MSVVTMFTCNGTWPAPAPGPCTARLTIRPDGGYAMHQLTDAGWSVRLRMEAGPNDRQHLCPAHTRRVGLTPPV